MNLIYASICAYLILGLTWSFAFGLVEFYHPGSFHGLGEQVQGSSPGTFLYAVELSSEKQINALLSYLFITAMSRLPLWVMVTSSLSLLLLMPLPLGKLSSAKCSSPS